MYNYCKFIPCLRTNAHMRPKTMYTPTTTQVPPRRPAAPNASSTGVMSMNPKKGGILASRNSTMGTNKVKATVMERLPAEVCRLVNTWSKRSMLIRSRLHEAKLRCSRRIEL